MSGSKEQLKEVQSVGLDIFREFITICEKLNLRYYILGGTLLGAVRHKGFIPWDDDIDVGMLREDYEVFLSEAGKYLPSHLFLQSHKTDREYHSNAAKIRNSNTTFIEKGVRYSDINHGIYIDIFPLDGYPDGKWTEIGFNIVKKILSVRIAMAFDKERKDDLLRRMCGGILRVVFPTLYSAVNAREKLFLSCRNSTRLINHCGAWGTKEIVPAQWYAEGHLLEFEGMTVSAPKEYKKWLTQVYGAYMQLPPVEQQIPRHNTVMIDVQKPYTEYAGLYARKKK